MMTRPFDTQRRNVARAAVAIVAVAVAATGMAAAPASATAHHRAQTAAVMSPCWAGDAGPWVVIYLTGGRTRDVTVTAVCRSDAKRQARAIAGRWIRIVDVFAI
jgi:hypothetical protein